MIELTPQERRRLRAEAHALHPVVSIGQHGLTPQVLHEIDIALSAHGLIKVRVFSDDRALRESLLEQIAADLDAAPVQHIGKLLVLWRPPAEDDDAPKRKPAPREPRARKAARPREPKAQPAVARRARGRGESEPSGDDVRRRRRRASAVDESSRSSPKAGTKIARAPAGEGVRRSANGGTRVRDTRGKSAPNPRRRRRST